MPDTFRDGLARSVAKFLGFRGSPGITGETGVIPNIQLDHLRDVYPLCDHWQVGGNVAGVAVQTSYAVLDFPVSAANPPGTLVVVDDITLGQAAANDWYIAIAPSGSVPGIGIVGQVFHRNGDHVAPLSQIAPIVSENLLLYAANNAANVITTFQGPLVRGFAAQDLGVKVGEAGLYWLVPGQQLIIQSSVQNLAFECNMWGRIYRAT
jgi:hypothetical protein